MKIIWLGHSSFRIEIENAVLLIDPWLTGNPVFPADQRQAAIEGATHIVLTHGHSDHIGDSVAIAKELGLSIAGINDLVGYLAHNEGVQVTGFNKGGTITCNGVKVTLVNASHSSSAGGVALGSACGLMIAGEGHVIYVSGDTDIMADMDWMGDYHKPDIGLLSAGGHFTMDMERATYAAKRYFNFKTVIPCHYRTFPMLAQNADVMKAGLPGVTVIEPQVLQPITL